MGTSISPKLNAMINKFENKQSSHDGKPLLEKTNRWFKGHHQLENPLQYNGIYNNKEYT